MERFVERAVLAWVLALGVLLLLGQYAPGSALAQRGRLLSVEVDPTELTLDDTATVKVVVQARHVNLRVPSGDDFELVSTTDPFEQPMFCMSMGYNVISGPCIYTFELQPLKEGKVQVPGFTLVGDDMTRSPGRQVDSSDPVELTVGKGSGQPKAARKSTARSRAQRQRQRLAPGFQQGGAEKQEELAVPSPSDAPMTLEEVEQLERFAKYDVFLLPKFAKKDVFVNEPFRVDFYIYIAEDAQVSQLQDLQLPELDGFRKEELEVKRHDPTDAQVGQRGYKKYLLARYVLIPLKAGETTMKPAEATMLVNSTQVQQFGSGFSVQIQSGSKQMSVFGPAVQVKIREMPAGAPSGFHSGNVGSFKMVPGEAPEEQPAGSWNMLRFDIEGEGNLFSVVPPELPPIPDLETREPHVDRSAVKATMNGIQGKVSVQIPFRVTHPGNWTLPALTLQYLDPSTGKYASASLGEVKVVASAAEAGGSVPVTASGESLRGILREGPTEGRGEWSLPVVWVAWGVAGLAALYLLALGVRGAWRMVSQMDPARKRAARMMRQARSELQDARRFAHKGDTKACFAALGRTIPLYLEARFGFSAGSKTLGELESALISSGVPADLAATVRQELESADFGRFAPSAVQGQDCAGAVERTSELLNRLRRVRSRSK